MIFSGAIVVITIVVMMITYFRRKDHERNGYRNIPNSTHTMAN